MEWKDIWQGVVTGGSGIVAVVASVVVPSQLWSLILVLAGMPLVCAAGVVIGWEACRADYRSLYEELVASEE